MPRHHFKFSSCLFAKTGMEILNTRYLKELISHIGKVSQVAEKKVNPRLEQQNEKHLKKRIFQRLRDTIMLKTTSSVPVYHFTARALWPKDQYVVPNYCFAVEVPNIEVVLSYEHSEYKWVSYEEGSNLLHLG